MYFFVANMLLSTCSGWVFKGVHVPIDISQDSNSCLHRIHMLIQVLLNSDVNLF